MCSSDSPSFARQRGLSIVELMVALAISSFLILGITQLYINNKKTYLFQQGQELNQENGRFTLALLSQELAKAGYRRRPDIAVAQDFPNDNASVNKLDCNFAKGAAVAVSDSVLCIRYQVRDDLDIDCKGNTLVAQSSELAGNANTPYEYSNASKNAVIVERFSLESDASVGTQVSQSERPKALVCRTNLLACGSGVCTFSSGDTLASTMPAPLITGIRELRFEYGTGTDKSVSTFSTTPATSDTSLIRAVRYAALLQTVGQGARDSSDTPATLTRWNALYSASLTGNAYLYQIAQDTITLRNLMP